MQKLVKNTIEEKLNTLGEFKFKTWATLAILTLMIFSQFASNVYANSPFEPLQGEFNVNNFGAATYKIPLEFTPGTGGVQPKLSLTYSSSGPNGIVGTGFSISGLSGIHRCPTNLADDGFIDGVDFDDNDRYCLDGQRLVAISGEYGANGTEYRTQIESFNKIVSYGASGNAPKYFKVWAKSGSIMEYGNTNESSINPPLSKGTSQNNIISWLLNKVEDRSGNYMTFHYYENETNGENYIQEIKYTGNQHENLAPYSSVEFEYETRPDQKIKYTYGLKTTISKRLKRIVNKYGVIQIRAYELSYFENEHTGASEAYYFKVFDANQSMIQEEYFEWIREFNLYQSSQRSDPYHKDMGRHASGRWAKMAGDYNGDGFQDMATVSTNENGWQILAALSNGDGTFRPKQLSIPHGVPMNSTWSKLSGDFNGDGLTDMAIADTRKSGWQILTALSNGDGTFQPQKFSNPHPANHGNAGSGIYSKLTGDFNGDGLTDMAVVGTNPGGWLINIALGNGDGTFQPKVGNKPYTKYLGKHDSKEWSRLASDFNGDGLTDMAIVSTGPKGWQIRTSLSNGDGTFQPQKFSNPHPANHGNAGSGIYSKLTGDFNGDGLTDMAVVGTNPGGWLINIALGNGDGTFQPKVGNKPYTKYLGKHDSKEWSRLASDFNGDGLTDMAIVSTGPKGWQIRTSLSNGDGTFQPQKFSNPHPGNFGNTVTGAYVKLLGDFNGDGLTDFAAVTTSPSGWSIHTSLLGGPAQGKIKSFHNYLGAAQEITYRPLTDFSVHSTSQGAIFPVIDLAPAMYVVSKVTSDNAVGSFNTFSYFYEGAKLHRQGRGFLGFASRTTTNVETGIETQTDFHQNFPYIGQTVSSKTNINNAPVSEAINTFNAQEEEGLGLVFVYLEDSITKQFDVNTGELLTTVTTENTFDNFGNPVSTLETTVDEGVGSHTTATLNTFTNDTNKWLLGKLTQSVVTKSKDGLASPSRTATFEYNSTNGLLVKEIVEPNSQYEFSKAYAHDAFGNQTMVTERGTDIESRTMTTLFDSKGQFPISISNSLGHIETHGNYDAYGNARWVTGPNDLTTTSDYDLLGRLIRETHANGSETNISYAFCTANCPSQINDLASYKITTTSTDAPTSVEYFDALNRSILVETQSFDGESVFVQTEYDNQGRITRESLPYFETPEYWTTYSYDALGRVVQENSPATGLTTYSYFKFLTVVTNDLGQVNKEMQNSLGQTIWTADSQENVLEFTYDALGNLTHVSDGTNVTVNTYDIRDFKTSTMDPDLGHWSYTYNVLGELLSQTDAKEQTITMQYDKLGRLISRTEPEGTTTWNYDDCENGIGKLCTVSHYEGYSRSHTYDSFGRPSSTSTSISGGSYTIKTSYDAFSRVDRITYPSNFEVEHVYNNFGYLEKVRNAENTSEVFYTTNAMDQFGNVTTQTAGNGVVTFQSYEQSSGRVNYISSVVQGLKYTFDNLGNLVQREDYSQSLREDFTYDDLNRLTNANVVGIGDLTMSYDKLGNITYKSDVGNYTYGANNAGPHAVTSIRGIQNSSYTYDANGNQITGADRTNTWSSYNKPTEIKKGNVTNTFKYGPDRSRFLQVLKEGTTTSVTTYVGDLYEKVEKSGITEEKHYIRAGEHAVAVFTQRNTSNDETQYLHRDHLGSIDTITDKNGAIVEKLSFDAFGKRRISNWDHEAPIIVSNITRGYTGHEMLDAFELIHMNGRIYDPMLGRFMSPDPMLQLPKSLQNYNRYSYVLNNPLSFTDPSGFLIDEIAEFLTSDDGKDLVAAVVGITIAIASAGTVEPNTAIAIGASVADFIANDGDLEGSIQTYFTVSTLTGFTSAVSTSFEETINFLGSEATQKIAQHQIKDIAERNGMTQMELNGYLFLTSTIGNLTVGSRFKENFHGMKGKVGFEGWGNRGLIGSLIFDPVDAILGYQGLPTASGAHYLMSKHRGKMVLGHSLGSLDSINMVRYGQAPSAKVYALPFLNVAPANVDVTLGKYDPINGGVLGQIFNPGATMKNTGSSFPDNHLRSAYLGIK